MNARHTALRKEEDVRLRKGGAPAGRLEFWRTQDVLRRQRGARGVAPPESPESPPASGRP
ncbi:hypothetical protein ACFY1U_31140 [Streptomyces sp. NPDC001351]|uniref:hypothetical protein n=1 Tax=Streptomyces sp. NPDC001351 TaxID=3364564 RepID=UPI0036B481C8